MQYIIGLVIMVASVVACIVMRKRAAGDILEVRYMQTSSIADVAEIFGSMEDLSSNYRHYVELKGAAAPEDRVRGPYSGQSVAYYTDKCYSVNETTKTGGSGSSTSRDENLVSTESSVTPVYITDGSCDTRIYLDMAGFGEDAQLISACNRVQRDLPSQGSGGGSSPAPDGNYSYVQCVRFDSPAPVGMPSPDGTAALDGFAFRGPGGGPGPGGMNRRPGSGGRPGGGGGFGGVPRPGGAPAPGGMNRRPGTAPGSSRPSGSYGGTGGNSGFGAPAPRAPRGGMGVGMGVGMGIGMAGAATGGYGGGSSRFLGYRLLEEVIPLNQQIYVLGEIYRMGDRLYIGKSTEKGKPSFLSCKSEEQLTKEMKQKQSTAIVVAVVGILIGLAFMWLFS